MSPVLVVGPSWVGDMVMTQALLKTLRRRHPNRPVDVLAHRWSVPLVRRMPEVRRAIEAVADHGEVRLGAKWRLARELAREGYGWAIVCPRSAKAALVPFLARIPQRTGYRGEFRYGLLNDVRGLDKAALKTPGERWAALGLPPDALHPPPVPEPSLRVDPENRARLLGELGLDRTRVTVALCPGAEHGRAKRWPPEHFGALARALLRDGHAVWLFGSPKERELGEAIAGQAEGAVNLCGRTGITDAVDLLSACRAAVCNDSGLMHVAAAVGLPVVALYGPSTPDYTPPLSDRATVLYRRLECSPCFARECPLGHHDCLRGMHPDRVREALLETLARASPGR